ncbi:MAG: V-type ATPase subunit [Firmicutes bacterium]|nr:V-type ATPase subunit [Bacillota bacterium]
MSKIRDNDYLCISAMLRGKEAHMIGADAFARMAEAENAQAAAKIAEEYGYTDLDLSTPQTVDASLGRIRAAVYEDLAGILPQRALLDLFRLKYDYHNAKILVKNASRDQDVSGMLSSEGRLSVDEIRELFASETASGVLKDAMTEAADTLAKTQNPQLSDFGLDLAYFREMRECAEELGGTSEDYIRLLIDCANLNSYVRSVRMGKSADFLKFALTEGGSIDPDVLLSRWPDTDVTDLYAGTALESASKFAGEAMGGWKITPFELACDNALTACLADTRYVPFGADAVVSYLASLDTEIMDLRMVLSGKICGISTEAIKERLRDVNV